MIDELEGYDIVRVYFDDGSSTVIHVRKDGYIPDKIVALCEINGWDKATVFNYAIEG